MQVKRRRRNVFFFIPALITSWVKFMTAQLPWTGWNRNRNAALRLLPLQRPVSGMEWPTISRIIASILLILRVTLISPLRWNVRCAFWTVPVWFIVLWVAFSPSRKQSGVRLTSIRCLVWRLSTRWTVLARTFLKFMITCVHVSRPIRFLCKFRLAQRTISRASLI